MNVIAEAIPAELRALDQWVVWRYELRDDEPTKVPHRVDGHGRASTTNPATWGSFEDAVFLGTAGDEFDGVGFVFSAGDPYCGVDLDDCIERGQIHPEALRIVLHLDGYTELSPSGRGVHVIVRANIDGYPRHRTSTTPWGGAFEVYDRERFFTVTGKPFGVFPA